MEARLFQVDDNRKQRRADLCFEALVEETEANPNFGRGRINAALKGIRAAAAAEGIPPERLPDEIHVRANAYRQMMPRCRLTPTALATHWCRVLTQNLTVEEQAIAKIRAGL